MSRLPVELARHLVVDAHARCRAIGERSAALAHLEFASSNPRRYASLIEGIVRVLERELFSLDTRLENDPPSVTQQIQLIDDFLQDLSADLRYIEAAVTSKLPWSLSRPLEALLKRYLRDRTLMLRPQWTHNYSIHIDNLRTRYSQELEQLLTAAQMDELFEDFPQGLHIISFPAIERKNALLHCDLAHEIGHLPAEDFLQREPKDYLTDFRDFVSVQVNTDPDIQPLWKTWYIGERLNKSVHIRQRALEELISDTFAARAFGPAALFALMAIASGQRLDVEPDIRTDFYPPWRTRLRRMLQVLRQNNLLPASQSRSGGYSEELERSVRDHIARIEELTAEQTDQEVLEQDPYIKLAYESVFATLQRVDAFLTSEFETAFIRPDALYGQLYDLVDRLVEGITPNELTSGTYVGPAALEAILNAAWWYRIHFLPRLVPDSAPAKGPTLRVLNRLTLKAAELAYVQGEFMAWQATPRAQP